MGLLWVFRHYLKTECGNSGFTTAQVQVYAWCFPCNSRLHILVSGMRADALHHHKPAAFHGVGPTYMVIVSKLLTFHATSNLRHDNQHDQIVLKALALRRRCL